MAIPDRQFTDAEVQRVVAKETLFMGRPPPVSAVDRLAVALFEGEINWILHMPDEKKEFDKLDVTDRERLLREACWLLGRLAIVGYRVRYER
jgi:hypothetical protein